MKKILFCFFLLIVFLVLSLVFFTHRKNPPVATNSTDAVVDGARRRSDFSVFQEKKSVFVPEWQWDHSESVRIDSNKLSRYDRFIYFGSESSLPSFVAALTEKERWFTLKITKIEKEVGWEDLVENTITAVKNHQLDGLVLDLEIAELPFENVVNQIDRFVKFFYTKAKTENIKLALAVYGDIFYRRRPYDLSSLEKNCDEIMIMSYDFHKSYGEPGPNFPFSGKEKYGYDFKTMVDDFLKFIPAKKLTVIFGMYGYDWILGEAGQPLKPATAVTLAQIKEKILPQCKIQNSKCKITVQSSKEKNISYIDEEEKNHIVWFEDEESVKLKTQYLKEKGIGSVAYWAWRYF